MPYKPQIIKLEGEGCNIKLMDVRLSFPELFRPKAQSAGSEPKYSSCFLINKQANAALIKDLIAAINTVAEAKWGKGKAPKVVLFGGDKCCLKEADLKDYDGYDSDHLVITASSQKPVAVVDKTLTPIAEDSGTIYAGCYVNASIRIWAQDNQYGRRVNAGLRAVMFVRDGEAFGSGPVDAAKEFEGLAEDTEGGFAP